jgi:hypothetical protein
LESSRLARTVSRARGAVPLIPAGEGAASAFFDIAVLSVFPFDQEQRRRRDSRATPIR